MTAQLPSRAQIKPAIELMKAFVAEDQSTYGMASQVLIDFALAAHEQEPVVNDAMALAFHHSLTDGTASRDDLDEIKTGLRAALANYANPAPVPAAQDAVSKLLNILDRHTVDLGWCEPPISLAELVIARDGREELDTIRVMLNGGKS